MSGLGRIRLYRKYNVGIKDPIIDETAAVLKKEKLFNKRDVVSHLSGVHESTLDAMFDGDTVSPLNPTTSAIMYALGYERRWVKVEKIDINHEMELADEWWRMRNTKVKRARKKKATNGTAQH